MELTIECTLRRLTSSLDLSSFNCGRTDLNEFLQQDALNYDQQLLGRTYVFTPDSNPEQIVCFFTVSNDGLKVDHRSNNTRRRVNKSIPHVKQMRNYPAVLIGRLGVNENYRRKGVGSQLMDFIKAWFSSDENKTGCRFLLVDAYNEKDVLDYYTKNEFQFLLREEDEEKKDDEDKPKTRFMFYDLIQMMG
ncbi:MAG TPA: GNAT family N-acetyltransferase [Cyclobacteriaceae bacterium]|nr:GNAT family N-acetyltransferase [Cyclobacteriaceae bacterium]